MFILASITKEENSTIMDTIILIDLCKGIAVRAILNSAIPTKTVYMAIYWGTINLWELSH
jgi:hypothetical protein